MKAGQNLQARNNINRAAISYLLQDKDLNVDSSLSVEYLTGLARKNMSRADDKFKEFEQHINAYQIHSEEEIRNLKGRFIEYFSALNQLEILLQDKNLKRFFRTTNDFYQDGFIKSILLMLCVIEKFNNQLNSALEASSAFYYHDGDISHYCCYSTHHLLVCTTQMH